MDNSTMEFLGNLNMADAINNLATSNLASSYIQNNTPKYQKVDVDVNMISEEDKRTSESNKNIQTIAEAKANCRTRLLYEICKTEECPACNRDKLIAECYNALPACDKLKVDLLYDELRAEAIKKKAKIDANKNAREFALENENVKKNIKFSCLLFFILLFVLILISISDTF